VRKKAINKRQCVAVRWTVVIGHDWRHSLYCRRRRRQPPLPLNSNAIMHFVRNFLVSETTEAARLSPLLAVPNITAHSSTASLPTSYYSTWHC